MFGPKPPAYSIGKANRLKRGEWEGPGPGDYEVPKEMGKGVIFSKSPRESIEKFVGPGPGDYFTRSAIGEGPRPIMISRKFRKSTEVHPGPSDYSPNYIEKTVAYSFRKHQDSELTCKNPGPGAYTPVSIINKSPVTIFTRAKRSTSCLKTTPGPGAYTLASSAYGEFIFNKASKDSKPKITPGPSDYEVYYTTTPNHSNSFLVQRPNTAKGPSQIKKISNFQITKSSKVSLTRKSTENTSQVFHTTTTEPSDPNKKFSKIFNKKRPLSLENFCQKPEITAKKAPSAVFGKSRRVFFKVEETPGPGEYLRETRKSCGFSFTKERKSGLSKSEVPGPGSYEIPNTIGNI